MHTINHLTLTYTDKKLSSIQYIPTPEQPSNHAMTELQAYFLNPKHQFNLPLHLEGTPFQKSVWHALQQIPSGTTVTYQALAQQLNTSPRAIGNACRANPLPIVIPCHRVVAKNGIGGYSGDRDGELVDVKRWLLEHEGGITNHPPPHGKL